MLIVPKILLVKVIAQPEVVNIDVPEVYFGNIAKSLCRYHASVKGK